MVTVALPVPLLPAASVAMTVSVYVPSAATVRVTGATQADADASPVSWQVKVEASLAEKSNVTVFEWNGEAGPGAGNRGPPRAHLPGSGARRRTRIAPGIG